MSKGNLMTIETVGKRLKLIHDYFGVEGKTGNLRDFLVNSSLQQAVTKNNVLIKGNKSNLWKWNPKYRLSIELAQLINNEYHHIRSAIGGNKTEKHGGFYTVKEASAITGIEFGLIYNMIRKGKITARKINGTLHLSSDCLEKIKKTETPNYIPSKISIKDDEKQPEPTLRRIVDQINNRVNGNAADVNLLIKWFEDLQENIRQSNERLNENDTDIALLMNMVTDLRNTVGNLKDELIPIRIRAERIENKTDLLRSEIDLMQEVDNHIGRVGKIRKFWRWLW